MPKTKIKLGDELQDVVTKVKGIAIGEVHYLDGTHYYILQPPVADDDRKPPEHYAPNNYCKRIGDGVQVAPLPPMGFVGRAD